MYRRFRLIAEQCLVTTGKKCSAPQPGVQETTLLVRGNLPAPDAWEPAGWDRGEAYI